MFGGLFYLVCGGTDGYHYFIVEIRMRIDVCLIYARIVFTQGEFGHIQRCFFIITACDSFTLVILKTHINVLWCTADDLVLNVSGAKSEKTNQMGNYSLQLICTVYNLVFVYICTGLTCIYMRVHVSMWVHVQFCAYEGKRLVLGDFFSCFHFNFIRQGLSLIWLAS